MLSDRKVSSDLTVDCVRRISYVVIIAVFSLRLESADHVRSIQRYPQKTRFTREQRRIPHQVFSTILGPFGNKVLSAYRYHAGHAGYEMGWMALSYRRKVDAHTVTA
jgi:hypothetical protein